MNPETPMLMITMQIPVSPDTSADAVLAAIGQEVAQALEEIKAKHAQMREEDLEDIDTDMDEETAREVEAFRSSVPKEMHESYSDATRTDLLAGMGYKAAA